MFVERLKKEEILAIFDKLGLFGPNGYTAYLKYGKLGKLVRVCRSTNNETWVVVNQFNKNGTIYTERNTTDNDKTFANCYLFSDFVIEPAQDNLTKRDYQNIQSGYRKAMIEIFGDEYLEARNEYNRENLIKRGFGEASKRSVYSNTFSDQNGVTILRRHKGQIAKAIKDKKQLELKTAKNEQVK